MTEPNPPMTDHTTPPTDARSVRRTAPSADPTLRADGGNPLGQVFELVDANRVSELRWAEDDDGRLYALERGGPGQESTVVLVDVAAGTAEKVDPDDPTRSALSPVEDVLGRSTFTD